MKNLVAQADRAAAQLALELTALEAGFEQPLTLSDIASAPARLWSGVGLGAVGGAVDSLRGLKSLTVDGMSLDPEERRDFRRSWGQIGRLVGIGASPTEVAEAWGQALGAMTGFSGVKAGIQAGDADLVTRSLGEAFASDALTGLGVRGLTSMTGTFLDQVVTGGRRVSGDLWTPRPLRGVAEVEGSSLATADGLLEIIDKNDPILDTIWGRGPSDPQHFAVATHPESFDLARITPEPVFREGDGVLWRLDRREPWTGQTLPDVFPPPSLSDMRAGKAVWGPDTPEEFLAAVEELHRTALAQDGPHRGIWQRGFEPRSLSLDPSHPSNLSLAQSVGDWDQFLNDSHDVIKSSIRQEANGSPFAISTSYGQGIRNWHAHLEADLEVPTFLYKINGAPGGIDVELTWAKARRMSMDEIDWIAHEEALLGEIARRPGSFTPDRIEELIERSRQSRVLKYEQEVLFFGGINPRYIEGAFLYRGVDPDGILSGGQVRGRYLGWFPNPNYRP